MWAYIKKAINSNLNKPLDTHITEKTDVIKAKTDLIGIVNPSANTATIMGYERKNADAIAAVDTKITSMQSVGAGGDYKNKVISYERVKEIALPTSSSGGSIKSYSNAKGGFCKLRVTGPSAGYIQNLNISVLYIDGVACIYPSHPNIREVFGVRQVDSTGWETEIVIPFSSSFDIWLFRESSGTVSTNVIFDFTYYINK
jgi:hypothetical protein